jgi:hypothetical protein
MLRSFELLQVASVQMSQQHGRMPFSVRQRKEFRSKTQIWEDSCNRPNNVCSRLDAILDKASHTYKVQLSGCQSPWSERSSLNMEIACSWSATVRTLGQHRLDAALFRKEFQENLESRLHSCPSGCPQLPSRRCLEKSPQTRFRFLWPINRDPYACIL